MNMYSIKMIFIEKTIGTPVNPHKGFNKDAKLLEERIILFSARDKKSALKKAQKEAEKYTKYSQITTFNQRTITEYLGWIDIYQLNKKPSDGVEVYSNTVLITERISDSRIFDKIAGKNLTEKKNREIRVKFLNKEFTPTPMPFIKGELCRKKEEGKEITINEEMYGVRTLYITKIVGRPVSLHKEFNENSKLLTERVVLFSAKGEKSALKKGEKEGKQYKKNFLNLFNQKVITEYLGWISPFCLYDEPGNGIEIYSSTMIKTKRISNSKIFNETSWKQKNLSKQKIRELLFKFKPANKKEE